MVMKLPDLMLARRTEIKAQMKELRLELAQIESFLAQLKSDNDSSPSPLPTKSRGNQTIKDLALEVLTAHPKGLDTQRIIEEIRIKFEKDIARPSMSPQLSRLKAEGMISQHGHIWSITKNEQLLDLEAKDNDHADEVKEYDL